MAKALKARMSSERGMGESLLQRCAEFMALATAKLPRKAALVALMGIFIVGNLLCALASDYNVLMFARVVTALCHGAFFGIGSVVAANLVPVPRT